MGVVVVEVEVEVVVVVVVKRRMTVVHSASEIFISSSCLFLQIASNSSSLCFHLPLETPVHQHSVGLS